VVPQSASHDQASGVSPTVDDLKPTNAPLEIGGEQQDPTHQRRHDLTPQDEDANPVDFTTCTDPQEVITVDAEMTAFDDRPTRQTARPLHANTQGEGTRQEMVHVLALTDTWHGNPTRKVYTHYSVSGATRIDLNVRYTRNAREETGCGGHCRPL